MKAVRHGRKIGGFTLIELMIAMLLGLLVVAAAISIFVANRRTYVATEDLGRVQESARVAFEIMARDLRAAGGNACDQSAPVADVVTPGGAWWSDWSTGVVGYSQSQTVPGLPTGTGVGQRVAGTEVVELKSAHFGVSVVSHDAAAAQFRVEHDAHGLQAGDLALVCDYSQASVFQVSGITNGTAPLVAHAASGTPGNCTTGLGLPVSCGGTGTIHIFDRNSTIAKVEAVRWFVGNNEQGGRSLFRQTRRSQAAGVAVEEVVPGVTGMTLEYLVPGAVDYAAAAAVPVTQWSAVSSVRVRVGLEGQERVGTSGERIARSLIYVASLRNRNP